MNHVPDLCISICGAAVPLWLLAVVIVARAIRRAPMERELWKRIRA